MFVCFFVFAFFFFFFLAVILSTMLILIYTSETRIVRGSGYSPASELFARVRQTMRGSNPKLNLVNCDAHEKIGQILTICSQGNEQKQNSDINQGPKLCQNYAKNDRQQSQARSCQCRCAYKMWSDSVNSFSRY